MRKIHYAGASVLTGDQTCKAVLRLARALAMKNQSDVIDFPIIEDGGALATAHFLIGPASEISSVPVAGACDEPNDEELIADFERRTRELQPSRPTWDDEMHDVPDLDWSDEPTIGQG
jgi:hypothetical protein